MFISCHTLRHKFYSTISISIFRFLHILIRVSDLYKIHVTKELHYQDQLQYIRLIYLRKRDPKYIETNCIQIAKINNFLHNVVPRITITIYKVIMKANDSANTVNIDQNAFNQNKKQHFPIN